MTELKPCPFCGGEAATSFQKIGDFFTATVYCKNLRCSARQEAMISTTCTDFGNIEEGIARAVDYWNVRV